MNQDIAVSNNAIIEDWVPAFVREVNAEKDRLGIKHNRDKRAIPSKGSTKKEKGEIRRIGVKMTKGEVFTHKGVGGRGTRQAKPWFNPIAETAVDELASAIAENTGDIISKSLTIR